MLEGLRSKAGLLIVYDIDGLAWPYRYYNLEVSYFKSSLDSHLLDLLWNKYWVSTLSTCSILTVSAVCGVCACGLCDVYMCGLECMWCVCGVCVWWVVGFIYR